MKLNGSTGFKRLSRLITVLSLFAAYFMLLVNDGNVRDKEALIQYPIVSLLIAISVYILIRSIYWVVDGFRADKKQDNE